MKTELSKSELGPGYPYRRRARYEVALGSHDLTSASRAAEGSLTDLIKGDEFNLAVDVLIRGRATAVRVLSSLLPKAPEPRADLDESARKRYGNDDETQPVDNVLHVRGVLPRVEEVVHDARRRQRTTDDCAANGADTPKVGKRKNLQTDGGLKALR